MILFLHELKRSRISLIIWTAVISFMLGITVLIYPQMAQQMDEISKAFSDMGSFSSAFQMDQLNFGELTDYFCVEVSNTLGLGGAIFAAITGGAILSKEERNHTAEFLFSHPVSRTSIVFSKLCAVCCQVLILNAGAVAVTALSILAIRKEADVKVLALTFLALLILHLEIAALAFLVSALTRGGMGLGIGITFALYFVNILANITDKLSFLGYFTPFALADGSFIRAHGAISGKHLAVSLLITAAAVTGAALRYRKKDI